MKLFCDFIATSGQKYIYDWFVKRINRFLKTMGLFFLPIAIVSCEGPAERNLRLGKEQASIGHARTSLTYFENALKIRPESDYALEAAREGSRISLLDLKDYKKALLFFRHIVNYSRDDAERLSAQKQIATISFEYIQDYQQSVVDLNTLLQFKLLPTEDAEYRLSLARAHYFLNEFYQAKSEIEQIKKSNAPREAKFNSLILLGNILMGEKDFTKAVELFKDLQKNYPDLSKAERLSMNLVVCYEEMQDYKSAIQTLYSVRETYSPPEYIDLKIRRLQERLKNQPGARGYRK